jgi:hypothetical protein
VWSRAGLGAPVTVVGSAAGPRLREATDSLQAVADRLDALRTVTPHVVWQRLQWFDGRVRVDAVAESGLYANVALLAARRLFAGYTTAGSGIQQLSGRGLPYGWRVRVQAAPVSAPIRMGAVAPGAAPAPPAPGPAVAPGPAPPPPAAPPALAR